VTLRRLMTQALTIQTVGVTSTDAYGNVTAGPVGVPVAALGFLEQKDTIEYQTDRETVVSKWTAFLPAETVIHPMDYLNFNAQKFQIDGEPHHVWNPRIGAVSHIECKLTVVT
jgi:hypothetical protein